jgi:hypothetical protein
MVDADGKEQDRWRLGRFAAAAAAMSSDWETSPSASLNAAASISNFVDSTKCEKAESAKHKQYETSGGQDETNEQDLIRANRNDFRVDMQLFERVSNLNFLTVMSGQHC